MKILGVKISEVTKEQALQKVAEFLTTPLFKEGTGGGQYKIFTPNPEMIVKAQKDEYFKKVLNAGDLNLCDGFGLWLAARLSFRPKRSGVEKSLSSGLRDPSAEFIPFRVVGMTIERIAGVDFMLEICRLAAEQSRGVYLLGSGNDAVVKKTAEELQKKFPNLKIVGFDKGPDIDELYPTPYPSPKRGGDHGERISSATSIPAPIRGGTEGGVFGYTIQQINQSGAEILFVAFGMGKQEKWIYENLSKMPSVKIAMGVGGSFDFISGNIKRTPLFMRRLGLEWMYRLIQEPRRIGRILNATVKFVYLVLKSKFLISNDKSNPND